MSVRDNILYGLLHRHLWPAELDADYRLLGELGRGGMAVVFRARDRDLGREVAVKVVRPSWMRSPSVKPELRSATIVKWPRAIACPATMDGGPPGRPGS